MDPQLFGNTPRCTRQAQEKRGQNPVHHRALAAIQECTCEVIEGALAALLFAAVKRFRPWLGVVGAPGPDVEALTAGTLEGPIFPAQRMDVGLTRCGVEEVVEMDTIAMAECLLDHESMKNRIGVSQLTIEFLDRYKPLEIERCRFGVSRGCDISVMAEAIGRA